MASNSTRWPSAQPSDHFTVPSLSGPSASQDTTFRRREPTDHEQSRHQTAGHSVGDTEADFNVSLSEHDVASEATNSTVITPEDLDRISREYDELVNETYRQVANVQVVQNSAQTPQEMTKRSFRAKQTAQKSSDGRKKRKMSFDELDCTTSEEPERPSTFLASIKTWRKTAGKRHPGEVYFQVEELSDVKRDKWGNMRIKAHWAPIWVPIQNLRGEESYEAAKGLVVGKFGEDAWSKASDGWDAMEPYAGDCIEYATE